MRVLVACLLVLLPLRLWAQPELTNCQSAWDGFARFVSGWEPTDIGAAPVQPADDQWCEVDLAGLNVSGVSATGAAFKIRAETEGARSVTVKINALEIKGLRYEVSADLSHALSAGTLRLNQLSVRGDDGRGVRAQGDILATDFDSVASAQSALAGARLTAVNVQFVVTPALLAALDVDLSTVTRTKVTDALRDVTQSQLSNGSRQEFLRFAGATPQARGTLDVSLTAPEGLGALQVMASLSPLQHAGFALESSEAWEQIFTGIMVKIVWNPGRM